MNHSKSIFLALASSMLLTSCDRIQGIIDEVAGGDAPKERVVGSKSVISGGADTVNKWKAEPNVLVVIDFYSDSCGPCRVLAPRLAKMAEKHGDKAVVLKVNVDRNGELAKEYGVRSIPDVRFFLNGEEVEKFVGAKNEAQLDSLFVKHVSEIDDDLPVAERVVEEEPSGPITVRREKGYLPPGVEKAKIPAEVNGSMQLESPAMKKPESEKPVVDMGPPPADQNAAGAKQ